MWSMDKPVEKHNTRAGNNIYLAFLSLAVIYDCLEFKKSD